MGFPPKMARQSVCDGGGRISVCWFGLLACFLILKGIGYPASRYLGNAHKTGLSLTLIITASSQ